MLKLRGHFLWCSMSEFKFTAKEVTLWTDHWVPSSPHQENLPWVCLFRPLSANNHFWLNYWPELEI
jgi:hypothetical protein